MSSVHAAKIVFLPSVNTEEKEALWDTINTYFSNEESVNNPSLIHIGECNWEKLGNIHSITYQVLNVLRKLQLLPHERSILLPLHDQYQTIQLCLAHMNKEKYGEFTASASDVLDIWKYIHDSVLQCPSTGEVNVDKVEDDPLDDGSDKPDTTDVMMRHTLEAVRRYKEFLKTSQCIDHSQMYSILKKHINSHSQLRKEIKDKILIVENVKDLHETEKMFLELLSNEGKLYEIVSDCKVPVVKSVNVTFSEYIASLTFSTPIKSADDETTGSKEYLVQLVLAHLRLVINPHDELALVLVCSMPGRDISQQDFMHINTMSKKKNMPKFQAILTYIKRIRALQPEPDCPVRKLSQPLANFVDEIEKLHGIASCEPDTNAAATRILETIKRSLITMVMKRGSILHQSTIEKVCESIKDALKKILDVYSNTVTKENSNISSEDIDFENNAPLEPCLKLLVHLCDFSSGLITCRGVVDAIGDNFLTHTLTSPQKATVSMRIPTVVPDHNDVNTSLNQDEDNDFENDINLGGDSLLDRILKKKGTPLGTPSTPQSKSMNNSLNSSILGSSPLNISSSPNTSFSPHMEATLRSLAASRKKTSDTTSSWKKNVTAIADDEEKARKEALAEIERQLKKKKGGKRQLAKEESKENEEQKNKKAKEDAEKPAIKTKPLAKGQMTLMSFFKPK